jgi:hypothetical protein
MSSNWMELGLTKDEEDFVRTTAVLYRAMHVDTLDTIFQFAQAIEILRKRFLGSGNRPSALGDALVQYGYTARDGTAMNKAVRSHLKTLLENEASVRAWWEKVNKDHKTKRTARNWLSASAIHKHWSRAQRPVDPDAPRKPSPYTAMKETNVTLQEQLHSAIAENKALKSDDGGNYFTAESSAEQIGDAVVGLIRTSPTKMRGVAAYLNKRAGEIEALIKTARPKR